MPAGDKDDDQNIPLWFRIKLRRDYPQIRASGKGQYPRSASEVYNLFYNNKSRTNSDEDNFKSVTVNSEVSITEDRYGAESAISINPVNTNLVIVGINGPSGQEMYYSSDAGLHWTRSSSYLGNSCCDPTVGWSPDGTRAYMAQLGNCSSLCDIQFFSSTDNGATWGGVVTVRGGGNSDKEYLHVDTYANSPHVGKIYIGWDKNNVMEFARSTDNGVTFGTPITFSGSQGIGCDITSDKNGKVYYAWPGINSGDIQMAISTNGGQSFGTPFQIADTNAIFDYPLPSFPDRHAFIYVSLAVDLSNGPHQNRIYACWQDTVGAASGSASQNHGRIIVSYSDDGTNWTEVSPHPTSDMQTVDRYNPWLDVDSDGTVHVAYYDTQNSADRLKNDMYHSTSSDGGVSWSTPVRITATSSGRIFDGFEWGDYNGLSVVNGEIRPIWTDNRSGIKGFTADMNNSNAGSSDFQLEVTNAVQTVCANTAMETVTITATSLGQTETQVSFSLGTLPTGFFGQIENSPTTTPGSVIVNLATTNAVAQGTHNIVITATSDSFSHDTTLSITVHNNSDLSSVLSLWHNANAYNPIYDLTKQGHIDLRFVGYGQLFRP